MNIHKVFIILYNQTDQHTDETVPIMAYELEVNRIARTGLDSHT
jgi:hypothetical protein